MFNHLKIEINKGLELTIRASRAAFKATYRAIGMYWQKNMLPRHFQKTAPTRYGYKPRTLGTIIKKKKLARQGKVESDGQLDLVWTGLMRRALLSFTHPMSVYPTRVTTHLRGPKYMRTNYKPGKPHLGRELTAVSRDEIDEMARFAQDELRDNSLVEFKKTKLRKQITGR